MPKQSKPKPYLMQPSHKNWRKFCDELEGPNGCNFKEGANGITFSCNNDGYRPKARAILSRMGADVERSLEYFDQNGGYCDCEILFNVDK